MCPGAFVVLRQVNEEFKEAACDKSCSLQEETYRNSVRQNKIQYTNPQVADTICSGLANLLCISLLKKYH